jgi:gluconokinase
MVGGLVYVARMFDKIRLHQAGKLPADYIENLGIGFDGQTCSLLKLPYSAIVERVQQGGTDEEILEWALSHGRRPDKDDIAFWNAFMMKRGWNDDGSPRLAMRLKEGGLENRSDIQTFFKYIDVDEER